MTDEFVNLHNHSDVGSILDGIGELDDYVKRAVDLGQPALAITDHGSLSGSYQFQKLALDAGINPIWGLESYVAPLVDSGDKNTRLIKHPIFYGNSQQRDRSEGGDVSGKGAYLHLTLLARNETGVHNLIKLNSESWLTGRYRKPRADTELLERYSDGLVFLSGCPSSEINTRLRIGDYDGAEKYLDWAIQTFGRENVFLEVMDHNMPQGIEIERMAKKGLLYLHDRFRIPFVATNDAHYARPDQKITHENMLCLQTGSNMDVPTQGQGGTRFALDGEGYYLRSGAEMRRAIPPEFVDACDNTMLIAEMCSESRLSPLKNQELWIDMSSYMPKEYGENKSGYLLGLAKKNLREIRERHHETYTSVDDERLEYEMKIIDMKGYPDYFAFVMDFTKFMKDNAGFSNPGRGSAGGSLVSYALGITLLDPLRYDLLFERFLNPERESPPDIDFDSPKDQTDALYNHVRDKFGVDKIMHIGTYAKEKAKNSIRDAAKILNFPYSVGDKLSKVVADAPSLEKAGPDLDAEAKELGAESVLDTARRIEGITRQTGVHACGVIASSVPIDEMAPLMIATQDKVVNGKKTREEVVVSQWEYPLLEELGFVKYDFLSLANLTIINKTVEAVKKNHGTVLHPEEIVQGPMDDQKTFALLKRGLTMGVFQLEGGGITELVKMMNADSIDDIAAVLALYRPGPMGMGSHTAYARRKNGKEEPKPIHPEVADVLAPVLEKTYNVCCYQEQLMKMAQILAGYSLAEADILRRAVGKKKKYILDQQESGFRERMMKNGYSQEAFQAVWDVIVPFSDYGFNASHAYGYALTTYLTAYLKANYMPEFMAALISVFAADGNRTKVRDALRECSTVGIPVKPPYINSAGVETTSDGKSVYLGFSGVAGCGDGVSMEIVASRPFEDVTDFTSKIGNSGMTPTALSSLIDAGAFDEMSPTRAAMTLASESILDRMRSIRKSPNDTLFGDISDVLPPITLSEKVPELPRLELLRREKAALGLYVSGHPLDNARTYIENLGAVSVPDLQNHMWENVHVCGIVSAIERKVSKKGNYYSKLTVEDSDSESIDFLLFGDAVAFAEGVVVDDIVNVEVKVRAGRDGDGIFPSVISLEKMPVDEDGNILVVVSVSEKAWDTLGENDNARLSTILGRELGGEQSVRIDVCDLLKIRDLGLKIPRESRSHEQWVSIVSQSIRSIYTTCDIHAGAPLLLERLGRIGFETWESRLKESEGRWKVA